MKRTLFSLLLAALLSMSAMGALAATSAVGEGDITRQAENTPPTDNWVLYTRNAGTGAFINGPATPPLGTGSLELKTLAGADKVFLFNYDHIGTELASVDAIGYSTYRFAGNNFQNTGLNIEVDFNGPAVGGGFTTLVFEPIYNLDQGPVATGIWQTWDAYNDGGATWWSTQAINGQCAGAAVACWRNWAQIVANNPDATILGGFGLNQGSGNPGLDVAIDALTVGSGGASTTYDFEVLLSPQSNDDCKKGGWQTFNAPAFKNQGDCVSWTNHN